MWLWCASRKSTVRVEDHQIPQIDHLSCLNSMTSKDVEIDENVEHRIKSGMIEVEISYVTDKCKHGRRKIFTRILAS